MLHKLDDIPIATTLEQALVELRVHEPEDVALITDLFTTAKEIARPKILYKESFVESITGKEVVIDGHTFKSSVLAKNLENIHRVFAFVCTCGTEVDDWSHQESDYIVSLWLDMIKEMFLYETSEYFKDHLKEAFGFDKLASVNPGSGDLENWPISQQAMLFDMIGGVKEEIGVTLTGTFLMVPIKSVSGLIYPTETEFVNCALCRRENCSGRKVPFDSELYSTVFQDN